MEDKGQHLVAWERVCTPKVKGGAGIRRIKKMNTMLLIKCFSVLAWKWITCGDKWWLLNMEGKMGGTAGPL